MVEEARSGGREGSRRRSQEGLRERPHVPLLHEGLGLVVRDARLA